MMRFLAYYTFFSFFLSLFSFQAYTRSPAVVGFEKMREAEIARQKSGKTFFPQYEALRKGVEQGNAGQETINPPKKFLESLGYSSILMAFLILLPMGMSFVIMNSKYGETSVRATILQSKLTTPDNVVPLSKFRKSQKFEQSDADDYEDDQKKAS